MLKTKLRFEFLLTLIFLAACSAISNAQSTILNTPSTDVVEEKKTYIEFDFLTHPTRRSEGGFRYYGWRTVYGIKKNFEIGLNGSRTDFDDPEAALDLQPNAKWQFYNNEEKGIATSVGGIMYIPTRSSGSDTFGLVYANISKQIKGKFGPRLTGGYYGLIGVQNGSGTRSGVMIGIEQPLFKKVSFATDFLSGKNRFGYVTPALVFTPTDKTVIGTGFTIGNQGRGNNAIYFYIGHIF